MSVDKSNQGLGGHFASQTGQLLEFFTVLQQVLAPATYPVTCAVGEIENEPEHTLLTFSTDFPAKFEDITEGWNYNAIIESILKDKTIHQNIRNAHYFACNYPDHTYYWWTYERELNLLVPKTLLADQSFVGMLFPDMENDERTNINQEYRKQAFLKAIYSIAQSEREQQQIKISIALRELSARQKSSREIDDCLARWAKMIQI